MRLILRARCFGFCYRYVSCLLGCYGIICLSTAFDVCLFVIMGLTLLMLIYCVAT